MLTSKETSGECKSVIEIGNINVDKRTLKNLELLADNFPRVTNVVTSCQVMFSQHLEFSL